MLVLWAWRKKDVCCGVRDVTSGRGADWCCFFCCQCCLATRNLLPNRLEYPFNKTGKLYDMLTIFTFRDLGEYFRKHAHPNLQNAQHLEHDRCNGLLQSPV